MVTMNPYLNFPGNTEEAFNFYKSVFGGEFSSLIRFKDTPEAARIPEEEAGKIMHIALPIGNGNVLMATDALESMGHKLSIGNNHHLSINTESKEEAIKLFNALADGGTVTIPLDNMFWGAFFGMLTDQFAVQWMINYDPNYQKAN